MSFFVITVAVVRTFSLALFVMRESPALVVWFQVSALKNRLKKVSTTTGDGVARAFLKAQASFFGSYRNALKIEPVSGEEAGICEVGGGGGGLTGVQSALPTDRSTLSSDKEMQQASSVI